MGNHNQAPPEFRAKYREVNSNYFNTEKIEGIQPSQTINKQHFPEVDQQFMASLQTLITKQNIMEGEDKRKSVTNTLEYPYSTIGFVSTIFKDKQQYSGTGFLIGEHMVLTCAHNCYYKLKGGKS